MSIEPASFLKDDYKYKIDYLTDRMTRMWTRFNSSSRWKQHCSMAEYR